MTIEPGGRGRRIGVAVLLAAVGLLGGCAAATVATFVYEQANEGQCLSAGCAAVAVLQHAVDKATEGDPTPCRKLNSVERALTARCGAYRAGSLRAEDVETCDVAPLVALARARPCPDFTRADLATLASLRWLAAADARAIDHDAVRLLSCPSARDAGLAGVLDDWLAHGQLPVRGLPFGVLGALHPAHLDSPLARALEASGHTARAGLGPYAGELPPGFDAALRGAHREALDWWLDRLPQLANQVPARQSNQLPWSPLARVVTPSYLDDPAQQAGLVAYLLARGADPWRRLPHDPGASIVSLARRLHSPALALLERPPPASAQASLAATPASLR
jgi:hypothetical protein